MGAPPVQGFVTDVYRQFPKFLPAPSLERLSQNGDPLLLGVIGLLKVPLLLSFSPGA